MRLAKSGSPSVDVAAPPPRQAPRLQVLDGLRLVAALMVVMFHYTALDKAWGRDAGSVFPVLEHLTRYTWLGVELFFLISGFVICMSS